MSKLSSKTISLLLAGVLVFSLAFTGCSSTDAKDKETTTEPKATETPIVKDEEPTKEPDAKPEVSSIEINNPVAVLGTETSEELYEQAIAEGGKLSVYSISSRMETVAETFQAKYPEIKVEVYDMKQNEIVEKVTLEYDAGIHTADVLHIKDLDGTIYNEYVLKDKFLCYYPLDICEHIDPKYLENGMPLYMELYEWYYNTEVYPEAPIDSWWDLTREELKGKVMMQNPLNDSSYMAMITSIVLNSDLLEADYEREFGEALTLSEGCSNAGEELLYRLVQNDLIFASSSDEVMEGVGTPGQSTAPIGLASSSKIRNREKDGLVIEVLEDIKPFLNNPAINYVYMMKGTEHPAAAKLFIRWILGEADGKGEGFDQFHTQGGWSFRDDVSLSEGNTPLEDLNMITPKLDDIYNSVLDVADFWTFIQK